MYRRGSWRSRLPRRNRQRNRCGSPVPLALARRNPRVARRPPALSRCRPPGPKPEAQPHRARARSHRRSRRGVPCHGVSASGNLQTALHTQRMAPAEADVLLRQAAIALDFAHGSGVVHGDLKPSNIFVSPQQGAKVSDFAISPAPAATAAPCRPTWFTPISLRRACVTRPRPARLPTSIPWPSSPTRCTPANRPTARPPPRRNRPSSTP